MLTYGDLRNHVLLALGGRPSTSPGQTVAQRQAEIVNQAGEHLFTHPWLFRQQTAFLSTVAGQPYASLPADFGEVTALWKNDQAVWLCSQEEVENARVTSFPDLTVRAYVRTIVPTTLNPVTEYRVELYPTPSSTASNVYKMMYRTAWQSVTASTPDDTVISIPPWLETVLVLYVRAIAESYEDGQQAQRLAEIELGPVFGAAKSKDGMLQGHYGQLPASNWRSTRWRNGGYVLLNPVQNP